ncbi:MAG: VWA domain-containing protein [Gammaproteobacteria bacterium]|nr:VWA domain-containing protein [Gammaproteobacteria bacterium]
MALKEFTVAAARPLPVILLADVSGSMSVDGKIQALNQAAGEMIASFADEEADRAEIQVAVITFGANNANLHQPFMPAAQIQWMNMQAAGHTPLGAALELVTESIEDAKIIPSRSYRPSLILVSDGQPNDEWRGPLSRLHNSPRASKAMRFAMGIGEDADLDMLQEFLADPEGRVFAAHEARQIQQFFRWVTMSVTQRFRSANPDQPDAVPPPPSLDDYDY